MTDERLIPGHLGLPRIALVVLAAWSIPSVCLGERDSAPRLVGRSVSVAAQLVRLSDSQLCVGRFYVAADKWRHGLREDLIAMQSPLPGTELGPRRTVVVWTFRKASPDQDLVEMPDLRGLPIQHARDRLTELALSGMDDVSPGEAAADVEDQYPRPGQKVFVGSTAYLQAAPSASPRDASPRLEPQPK